MRFFAHLSRFAGPLGAVAAVLVITACNSTAVPDPSPLTLCTDPRPQVCTMIYAPVCAVHVDGRRETLASACNACADATVSSYLPEPCEDLDTP